LFTSYFFILNLNLFILSCFLFLNWFQLRLDFYFENFIARDIKICSCFCFWGWYNLDRNIDHSFEHILDFICSFNFMIILSTYSSLKSIFTIWRPSPKLEFTNKIDLFVLLQKKLFQEICCEIIFWVFVFLHILDD
jgi:hypothetical protein